MVQKHIDVEVTTAAEPAVVYALLRDGSSWPVWSPLGSFELAREGSGEPEGLGAVRVFRTGRFTSWEEVVELVPDRRFSYALRHGLPLRGYRADVDLTPEGTGTRIRWHSSFRPGIFGTGWFYRWFLGRFIARMADGLAAHSVAVRPRQGEAP
nr:SRPBCC family protein [Amycolatopsis anabasis]